VGGLPVTSPVISCAHLVFVARVAARLPNDRRFQNIADRWRGPGDDLHAGDHEL
jgi:hypothetical protein